MKKIILFMSLFFSFSLFSEVHHDLYQIVTVNIFYEGTNQNILADHIYVDDAFEDIFSDIKEFVDTSEKYNNFSFQSGDFYLDYNSDKTGFILSTGFFLSDYDEEVSKGFSRFKTTAGDRTENKNDCNLALKLGDLLRLVEIEPNLNKKVSSMMINENYHALYYEYKGVEISCVLRKNKI